MLVVNVVEVTVVVAVLDVVGVDVAVLLVDGLVV